MLNYKLRNADKNDLQLAYDIRKNALGEYVLQTWGWDEKWQLEFHLKDFNPDILQFIECEGIKAGSIELIDEKDSYTVSGIYIIDKFQSKGIGRDVMKNIMLRAKKENKNVKLQVLKVNKRAMEFYLRLGFKQYGENETHYQYIYEP